MFCASFSRNVPNTAQCCHAVAAFDTTSVNKGRLMDIQRKMVCGFLIRGVRRCFWLVLVKLRSYICVL